MRKKRWNRYISFLMVVVMSVTILAGTGITVMAEAPLLEANEDSTQEELPEEQMVTESSAEVEFVDEDMLTAAIPSVELTILDSILLAGSYYTSDVYNQLSNIIVNDGNCTVESIAWKDNAGNPLQEGARLEYSVEYSVNIVLIANSPETFNPNATVKVNGETLDSGDYLNRYMHSNYEKLQIEWTFKPNVIESITSINITTPVVVPGNVATPYSYIHNENGVDQYTVNGTWSEYDESTQEYKPMASTDTFQDNGSYQLELTMQTKPGFVFDNPAVGVNGGIIPVSYSDNWKLVCCVYMSVGTPIDEVEFTVPEPVVGQNFSNATPITATVPSGSHYTVKGNWIDEDGNSTGTFTQGKEYYFDCKFYANDGFYFAEDIWVDINSDSGEWTQGKGKRAYYQFRKSLRTAINEVVLFNVPKAELGKSLQIGEFAIEVPDGAKYQASGLWFDEFGNPITNGTVEAGKTYDLQINLYAFPAYEFADSYILKINGSAHQIKGGYSADTYFMEYSFLEQIDEIEVTGVIEPVIGQLPSVDTLKVAEPEKYEIVDKVWIDRADGSIVTKFEDGHAYQLRVTVKAKSGYEFAPYASWKLGEEIGTLDAYSEAEYTLSVEYSFETVIPEIRVNNIPTMKVGESARVDVTVPDGANYTAVAEWIVWNDAKGRFEPFSGIFEQGKTYILLIRALSNIGYRFENGVTVCYLDGVLDEDVEIVEYNTFSQIYFVEQDAIVIHKVELNINKPVVGDHSSIEPVITLPENANYRQDTGYITWFSGNVQEPRIFSGYFAEDANYGTSFSLVANDGYIFAEDLVVVVNGVVIPTEAYDLMNVKEMNVNYFFDMTCQHIYEDDKDGICDVCGYQRHKGANDTVGDVSPNTGDQSMLSIWLILFALSGIAIIGMSWRRSTKDADIIKLR